MTKTFRGRVPIARVQLGEPSHMAVSIYADTKESLGVPLVELAGAIEYLQHMTPEQAKQLADGLVLAVRAARGEVLPTPLDEFLNRPRA